MSFNKILEFLSKLQSRTITFRAHDDFYTKSTFETFLNLNRNKFQTLLTSGSRIVLIDKIPAIHVCTYFSPAEVINCEVI